MEMKTLFVLFTLKVSVIRSQEINLNQLVDENIYKIEDSIRKLNWLNEGLKISGGSDIADKYSFPTATVLGLDKVRRTGDCKLTKEGRNFKYKLNFGSGFLAIVIPRLRFKGEDMSAVLRVKNNSLYLAFDRMVHDGLWNITLNDLTVMKLGQVEFWSSDPQYDGTDVENIFENLRLRFNDLLMSEKVEVTRVVTYLWYKLSSNYTKGLFNEL